jgi:hemerythrin-like metal-binding protein
MLWNKSLETGIAKIDNQHKELFRQIDILMDVKNTDRIKETLNFLSDYIVMHFKDEEKLQADSKYPKRTNKGYQDNYVWSFT